MHRRVIALALAALGGAAAAQPAPDPPPPSAAPDPVAVAPARLFDPAPPSAAPDPAAVAPSPLFDPTPGAAPGTRAPAIAAPASVPEAIGDQAVAAELGLAGGGRVTPGGMRIAGHFFYQLSDRDWFDGVASFTFGSGRGACFRDRQDRVLCSHGVADGTGIEVVASVRRMLAPRGVFQPFARAGLGVGLARFDGDDVSGFALPLHGGGGLRIAVADAIAVVAEADLALGVGWFGRGLGAEPQFGLAVAGGVEFRLR